MYVDPNKVNLAEKDIEDWLWENPTTLFEGVKWLGRQIVVPSGIIDLLGYFNDSDCDCLRPIVIELKNTEFTQASILQVCRYAADINSAIDSLPGWDNEVAKVVIAKGAPSAQLLYEADAVDVSLCTFNVEYSISVSNMWGWKDEAIKRDEEKNKQLGIAMFLSITQSKQKHEVPPDLIENMRKIDAQPPDDCD